jgi:hypothetical protein
MNDFKEDLMAKNDLPTAAPEMLTYAFIACTYLVGHDSAKMKTTIQEWLDKTKLCPVKQTVIWGAVSQELDVFNMASVFVMRQPDTGEYTVVVRGTNPLSAPSWVVEDFDTKVKLPWDPADPAKGSVSRATWTALCIHQELVDGGLGLFDFLDELVTDSSSVVNFAGHSLGGLMAPVLALKYAEHLAAVGKQAAMSVYSFAGPTPGDQAFADYMTSVFTSPSFKTVSFVRSSLDVVPHAWNYERMQEIKFLYPFWPATDQVKDLIDYCADPVKNLGYIHAFPGFQHLVGDNEESILRLVGLEAVKTAAQKPTLKNRLDSIRDSLARTGLKLPMSDSDDWLQTSVWFLWAALMHVLPYIVLCLEEEVRPILFEEIVRPYVLQGVV